MEKILATAVNYIKTHNTPYRYLAYRDVPQIIRSYLQEGRALDYGTGTGRSAQFLVELGFNVVGVDVNPEMLHQAKLQYPNFSFHPIENGIIPFEDSSFDLVFSSFVLSEISSRHKILKYLTEAKRVMKNKKSLFIAITGSERLYHTSKKWLDFNTDFPENNNLVSSNPVKLYHCPSQIEFADYYWTEVDYQLSFQSTGLNLIEIKSPLGNENEGYPWQDELVFSPFIILIATPNF